MASLDYQMIRQAVREEFDRILGLPDECDECTAIGPIMAILEGQREEIAKLKARIAELEKRPVITCDPIQETAFDHLYRPWNITYTRPE